MAEVEAVKEPDKIKLISYLLKRHFGQQLADIWDVGLNLALRISDLLSVRFTDIKGDRLVVLEQKTGKTANIQLNAKTLSIIERIRQQYPLHIYLFQSHRHQGVGSKPAQPISRRYVTRAFAYIGEEVGVALGTHSMRKTRGYHLYQSTNDLARVMRMLRHSSEGVTLRYIGLTQDEIDKDFVELEI
jgi:integrase